MFCFFFAQLLRNQNSRCRYKLYKKYKPAGIAVYQTSLPMSDPHVFLCHRINITHFYNNRFDMFHFAQKSVGTTLITLVNIFQNIYQKSLLPRTLFSKQQMGNQSDCRKQTSSKVFSKNFNNLLYTFNEQLCSFLGQKKTIAFWWKGFWFL